MAEATYTLSQIRGKLRLRLDDPEFPGDVLDEAVNNYINDFTGAHNLVFLETTAPPLSLLQNTNVMAQPDDLSQVKSLTLVSPINYVNEFTDAYSTYNEFHRAYPYPAGFPTGCPSTWTEWAENFVFNVRADQDYTFVLDYMRAPTLLVNDADVCIFPNEFIECVVDGAMYRIQKRDDDYDVAFNEKSLLTPKELALLKRYASGRSHGRGVRMTGSLQAKRTW